MAQPEEGLKSGAPAAASAPQLPPDLKFAVPVDTELKATRLRIFSFAQPHMAAFHLSWFSFFCVFVSTFGPASLVPYIKVDLGLSAVDLGNAAVASVISAVFSRIAIGVVCDLVGARYAVSAVLLATAFPVFFFYFVTNAAGYIATRFFIGLSLSVFVCCQYWVGSMFNVRVVGTANAVAAGWGNAGGGATQLLMPLLYDAFHKAGGYSSALSWRYAFFIPGALHVIMAAAVALLGQDTPQGNLTTTTTSSSSSKSAAAVASKAASKPKESTRMLLRAGLLNYRTWLLALQYGYCFGVELTVDNTIHTYYHDEFGLPVTQAGAVAATFGLMNLFTRATGGMISDLCAKYYGMRGRIWVLWLTQSLGGAMCIVMGVVTNLPGSIVVMLVFSVFCQQACGMTFGVAPFVSRRAYGVVSGLVGAGGSAGAALTQAIFFGGKITTMTVGQGYVWMGVMILGVTQLYAFLSWPAWGGMFVQPVPGATEEQYYLSDYSPEEINQGIHSPSVNFAFESRSQRGSRGGSMRPPRAAAGQGAKGGSAAAANNASSASAAAADGGGGGGGGGAGVVVVDKAAAQAVADVDDGRDNASRV